MPYLRVMVTGNDGNGGQEMSCMTSIQVMIPAGLKYEHAKAYALAHISQELDRYGLGEALRGIGVTDAI